MQSQTKGEMLTVLEHYHKILQNENLKAAPDKSHFFLTRIKFLGHNIERNTITLLKSRTDAIQKLQPPTNKKKIQEFLGMLNFLSKYVYKMQLYLRPFYNILRLPNKSEWTTEHQTRFEEIKKLLTEQISNTIPDPNQPFYALRYFRKFNNTTINENTDLLEYQLNDSTVPCLPLSMILIAFNISHTQNTKRHSGSEKTYSNFTRNFLFPKCTNLDKSTMQ